MAFDFMAPSFSGRTPARRAGHGSSILPGADHGDRKEVRLPKHGSVGVFGLRTNDSWCGMGPLTHGPPKGGGPLLLFTGRYPSSSKGVRCKRTGLKPSGVRIPPSPFH